MKIKYASINSTIFIGTFLALLIPICFAIWFITTVTQEKLYTDFDKYRVKTTKNAAIALSDPIYFYSPNNGGLALEILKYDPRVVKIVAYDTLNEIDFLEIYIPDKEMGNLFTNKEIIYKNKEAIGTVTITYCDFNVKVHMEEQKIFFIQMFTLIFVTLFGVLFPLLYFKILSPLKKLTRQARNLKDGKLEKSCTWSGGDEINQLGQSFELARNNILKLVNEIKEVSITDKLTNLYNRHKLDDALKSEKNRSDRYQNTFGVIIIDIDNFKNINDTCGHQTGDIILAKIAQLLKQNSRESDVVGRWGGEEFLIICTESTKEGTALLAEKLRQVIESYSFKQTTKQTISLGVTSYKNSETINQIIARADSALYEAKSAGKNRVTIK